MKYSGFVYDKSKHPLKGIRVSDGRNVSVTDEKGYYQLDGWEREAMIYCNVLTTSHNDWFTPITEGKTAYDFYISPVKDQNNYTFLHLADTEIENKGCDSFIPWLRKTVEENSAAFLFHGGDLSGEDGVNRHFKEMNRDTIGCPVRYCIGNHDFLTGDYAEQRYEELYGPIWYSFDLGNVHYVSLPYPESAWGFYTRYDLYDQYKWLKNDLEAKKDNKPFVIFRHNDCKEAPDFIVKSQEDTYDLRKMGLIAWIQGHDHTNFAIEKQGVLHMCSSRPDSGGVDNTPGSVRRIKIENKSLTTDIQYNLLPQKEKAKTAWLTKLNGFIEFSDLVEDKNNIYCATSDDGYPKKCGIYCLNKNSGKIRWFFQTENSVKSDIALSDNRIFAQDCEGYIYCLDSQSGHLLWKYEPKDVKMRFLRGSVLVKDEIVYAGNGKKPLFLRASDGTLLFEGEMQRNGDEVPSKTIFSDDKKTIFYGAQWLRLAALDSESGKTLWDLRSQKKEIGNPGAFWYRTNTPLYHDGKIYAFGFSHGAIADAKTGEVLLHKPIPHKTEVVGSGVIDDGILYLPTATQGVVALDPKNLEKLWSYPVDGGLIFSASYEVGPKQTVETSPKIVGGEIVFAANDGFVYFYDKKAPILKKKIPLEFATLSAPILHEDHLFAASFDGSIGKYRF